MIRVFHVDAFTDKPFSGNPAAVALLPRWPDAHWLQNLAFELQLSETAFVVSHGDEFELRWCTPAAEVDLCGHATLAAAHVLWQVGVVARDRACRFHTKSGILTASRTGEWIELDLPAVPPEPAQAPLALSEALGVSFQYVGRTRFDYLVEVASEAALAGLRPDFDRLRALPVEGVIATARASAQDIDFVSRYFAPAVGVNEDPVTGAAHCTLTPYWSGKLHRTSLVARQISPRGGILRASVDGDRVKLSGQAVTITQGELALDPFIR